ncbi:AAI domain-containing protein [Caenorhabditis elegans]|uniref:AAI domain-containing protein n=1 Tax=Caenorhabditis elegans TaxID=6239 RepID=C7FZT9_CAEEL|nr:AAI domain-containing protein [Caenorhabditis elegans]CBA11614.1 AAI domain-containing protein [Caenorhabditis elegans]|eukprot:NP_001254885.1 Uncharacterized protein CELE_T02C12.5 [Caenorhabditis elegans]
MSVYSKSLLFLTLLIGMGTATWQNQLEDTGCVGDGCESEETNNKFALLFRQMLAKQREDANTDCAIMEDCAEGFECFGGKCRSVGQRRTKIINLYSRW